MRTFEGLQHFNRPKEGRLMGRHDCCLMGRKSVATHVASSVISVIPNFFTMVRNTVEQRIFIVETYLLKRQNYDRCACKFRRRFPGATVLTKPCIIKLFRKWREQEEDSFDRAKTGRYPGKNADKS